MTVLVVGWFVAGLGMGLAYARISSSAMNDLPPDRIFPVATAVDFAELSGAAVGAFVGGGTYALIRSVGASAPTGLGWSFGLLTAVAIAALLLSGRLSAQVQ